MRAENPVLIVRHPKRPDQRVPLAEGDTSLGRLEDNDVCLSDLNISRRHARISVSPDGEVSIEDLNSGNGIWIHGRRLRRHQIVDGDEISIEPFTLFFELPEEPAPQQEVTNLNGGPPAVLPPGAPRAELKKLSGPGPELQMVVPDGGLSIGRGADQDVVLRDPSASRAHAEVLYWDKLYWIRDSGSANGVYLNDQKVAGESPLQAGDVIQIGETRLWFTLEGFDLAPPVEVPKEEEEDFSDRTEMFSGTLGDGPDGEPWSNAAPPPAFAPGPSTGFSPPPGGFGPPPASFGAPSADASGGPPPGFGAPPPPGNGFAPAPPNGFTGLEAPAAGFSSPNDTDFRGVAKSLGGGPDLGAAPVNGAFGGPAPGEKPQKRSALSKPINQLSLLLLLGAVVLVGYKQVQDSGLPGAGASPKYQTSAEVELLMNDGMQLFQATDYRGAAGKFLEAIQKDPAHEPAERMGYLAVELIAIKGLQEALEINAESAADRDQLKADALAAAESARGGRAIREAREQVERALRSLPGDPELTEAEATLRRKLSQVAKAVVNADNAAFIDGIKALFSQAQSAQQSGDADGARAKYEQLLRDDPDDKAGLHGQARAALSSLTQAQAAKAVPLYESGMKSLESGDYKTARATLRQAVRYDANHSGARTALRQAEKQLEKAALEYYQSGVVMENASQIARAIQNYQLAIQTIDDSSSSIHRNAQARINRLME